MPVLARVAKWKNSSSPDAYPSMASLLISVNVLASMMLCVSMVNPSPEPTQKNHRV
jgi:hypothetical protein